MRRQTAPDRDHVTVLAPARNFPLNFDGTDHLVSDRPLKGERA